MQGIAYLGNRRTEKSEWTVRSPQISNIRNDESPRLEDKGKRQVYQSPGDEVTSLKLELQGGLKPQRRDKC